VPIVGLVKVNLPDNVHRQAKAAAALAGKPLRDWLKAAVEVALERPEAVADKLPEADR
jgi:predicted HicB family RNase H-like nuclease